MLGRYLGQLAGAMGSPDPERDIAGLIEPVRAGVGRRHDLGRRRRGRPGVILVTAEELVPDEIEFEVDDDFTEDDIEELLEAEDAAAVPEAPFTLRLGQAAAFAEAGRGADLGRAAAVPAVRSPDRPRGPRLPPLELSPRDGEPGVGHEREPTRAEVHGPIRTDDGATR